MRYLALILVAMFLASCSASSIEPDLRDRERHEYLEPTSPQNVVDNLETAYRTKDIDGYVDLLAEEFRFFHQPMDIENLETYVPMDRSADSLGTWSLFSSPFVSDIRVTLIPGDPEPAASFPEGTVQVRVYPTFLEVDHVAATYQVDGDIQDLFFRKGNPDLGENGDHWFLVEWRDVPDPAGKPGFLATEPITWDRLKSMFVP